MASDSQIKQLVFTTLMVSTFSGCWVKKTACRGLSNQMPGTCKEYTQSAQPAGEVDANVPISSEQPSSAYAAPTPPTITTTSETSGTGFALSRSTPEQLSNNIILALNYGNGTDELRFYNEDSGQTHDYLQILFGVALGGIDFETSSIRDRSTKAQTLLVSRVVAMELTRGALYKEYLKPAGEKVVFSKCDMNTDRPFRSADLTSPINVQSNIKAGEVRWGEQVEELFYRFYQRPPTTDEVEAVKVAFLAAADAEGYVLAGWVAVFYAMLSSQEFWHQ
jgi:hypothetical protein